MKRRLLILLGLLILLTANPAVAQSVPPHLAAMAKQLLKERSEELQGADAGDPDQQELLQRAEDLLKASGMPRWSAAEPTVSGIGGAVAEAVGLNPSEPEQWALLHELLAAGPREHQLEVLQRIAAQTGAIQAGPEFDQLVSAYDQARAAKLKSLERRHVLEVGNRGDTIELEWRPLGNRFDMALRGKETQDGADDGFSVQLQGEVELRLNPDRDEATLVVVANDEPLMAASDQDIENRITSIYGQWRERTDSAHPGAIWEILPTSSAPDGPVGETAAEQIERLQQEIKSIRSDKVYRWRNPDTGSVDDQTRFRRLDEPWEYEGEVAGSAGADERIAELEKRVEGLRRSNQPLPVEQHDPARMKDMAGSADVQPLLISITFSDGYSVQYDQARMAGGRLTARRTLRDVRDIVDLPPAIVSELVRSWNPPEWIELQMRPDPETRNLFLTGDRWRLHVTWSDLYGPEVESIHTPFSKELILEQAGLASAEGAAADERP